MQLIEDLVALNASIGFMDTDWLSKEIYKAVQRGLFRRDSPVLWDVIGQLPYLHDELWHMVVFE